MLVSTGSLQPADTRWRPGYCNPVCDLASGDPRVTQLHSVWWTDGQLPGPRVHLPSWIVLMHAWTLFDGLGLQPFINLGPGSKDSIVSHLCVMCLFMMIQSSYHMKNVSFKWKNSKTRMYEKEILYTIWYALCRLSSHEFKFIEKYGKVFKTNHKALIRFYITETFQHKTPQFRIWDHYVYLFLYYHLHSSMFLLSQSLQRSYIKIEIMWSKLTESNIL